MTSASKTLRTAADLAEAGLIPAQALADAARVAKRYAVAITPAVLATIDRNDRADPIARQFVPDVRELQHRAEELADPIGDHLKSPVKGLVHRYPDRVLLKVVGVCPVYCRFCFRREMVGPDSAASLSRDEIDAALCYIRARSEIWEVILTGGDPLMLSATRIRELTDALAAIAHVKVIRWHTRVPVVSPERVTPDLVSALRSSRCAVTIGVHANHPRELSPAARAALRRLADAGLSLVSQSVLLRGVNDDADTMEALMRGLVEAGVKPYYLHHMDLAPGTSHFRTTIAEGQALMGELRRRLSGLALPTYVLDIPGAHGKVPIGPGYMDEPSASAVRTIRDGRGTLHHVPDGEVATD
ncbi:MAG: lysine-2,3-aminomutase-like protein [Hyphomicrobium sp.]